MLFASLYCFIFLTLSWLTVVVTPGHAGMGRGHTTTTTAIVTITITRTKIIQQVPRSSTSFGGKAPDKAMLIERFVGWLEKPVVSGQAVRALVPIRHHCTTYCLACRLQSAWTKRIGGGGRAGGRAGAGRGRWGRGRLNHSRVYCVRERKGAFSCKGMTKKYNIPFTHHEPSSQVNSRVTVGGTVSLVPRITQSCPLLSLCR